MMFSGTRRYRSAAAVFLFVMATCARFGPASAQSRANGQKCTKDEICNSGSCYLGPSGDQEKGVCQCKGRCYTAGCAGCPSDQQCRVTKSRVAPNYCVSMDELATDPTAAAAAPTVLVAPETMRSLPVGARCQRDLWCINGSCYLGKYGNLLEGVCECKGCDTFLGCGGCDRKTRCLSFNDKRMNVCLGDTDFPTFSPTQPTTTPTKFPKKDSANSANGVHCTKDSQCASQACYLGADGNSQLGRCHCLACNSDGCGSCPAGQSCVVIHPMIPNQCTDFVPMPTGGPTQRKTLKPTLTKKPTKSPTKITFKNLDVGARCREDDWCRTKICFKKEGATTGKCECKAACTFSRCGGCTQANFHCASDSAEEANYCKRIATNDLGDYCTMDEQCISGSCWKPSRATGWLIKAHCQCTPDDAAGSSASCAKSQICEVRKAEGNHCTRYKPSAAPTPPPTAAPTDYRGKRFGTGEPCIFDGMCKSQSCYRGRDGTKKNGVCECRPCATADCGECTGQTVCLDMGVFKNKCVGVPSAGPTEVPSSSQPTTSPTSQEPTPAPWDRPTKAPQYPTGWPTRTKPKLRSAPTNDRLKNTDPPTSPWLYTGEICLPGDNCVTGCCFFNKCKSPLFIFQWLCA
eukprot:CAMPEP_0194274978 /NCGR_PEP_ID=MMETSP0169-20130528/7923_1 /TAXON_ID=218684 /ORGANISM="Corethron pennatum, Strain L29A3" /LENGTH=630 /DNA_ID=CAMNT_0039018319 /DNA_START=121 /DNA_END=2013 /DNA_ORIENTATION=-